MPEAEWNFNIADRIKTAAATISAGELQQEADGRAGVNTSGAAYASGDSARMKQSGPNWSVAKASGVVILDGGRVYWDHSANSATYKRVNDRDYYLGRAIGDAASADTEMDVDPNVGEFEGYALLLGRDPFRSVTVGTQVLGGLLPPAHVRGTKLKLDTTNQAQKVDLLSKDGFATGANAIVEYEFEVVDDGSGSAPDASIGIANATHADDANDVNIYAESDDGSTEVAATDTTIDYTAGTRVYVWFDMRNPADIQIYVNGSLVLGSTVFNVNASVATWKLLMHLEKTAAADIYELDVDFAGVRTAEQ
jgi:hypothetical protein